jgi:hypothetical protein
VRPEIALLTLVLAAPAVSALAVDRGYQLRLRQKTDFPAIRAQLISEIELYTHDGTSQIYRARVQLDAVAREGSGVDAYAQASELGAAINDVLTGFRGDVGVTSPAFHITGVMRDGTRVGYDPDELTQVVFSQDYIVWFRV